MVTPQLVRATALAAGIAAATITAPTPAHADFTLCNKTSQDVVAAAAWVDPHGNGFTSQGWWTLHSGGECKTLVLTSETSDPHNYFYYAKQVNGGRWEGDVTLCTEKKKFLISGPSDAGWCNDVGFIAHDFVHVGTDTPNHTTNLTERSPAGGGQRIDENP